MRPTALLTAALLFVTVPASAQPPTAADSRPATSAPDARWQPWLGCWELVTESVHIGASSTGPSRRQAALLGTRVCVAPSTAGVILTTWIGDQRVLDDTIVADGVERPVVDEECRGTQRTEWSANGRRLFASAAITCADRAPRKVDGLALLTAEPTWVDIQVIDIGGRKTARVRRYARVEDDRADAAATPVSAWRPLPLADGGALTVADVIEASAKVSAEAVQAALVELDATFDLDSRHLIQLDDAAVPGRVIDLMVALSYPQRFVVDRPRSSGPSGGVSAGQLWPWLQDTVFWSSYYTPFGYSYWGLHDPYGYPGSGFVVIGSIAPGEAGDGVRGRVVKDLGYTQVRPRPVEPRFVPGAAGGSGATSSTSGSSGSSAGTSGVSGQGYSGGTSGGGTRTAQPRPPGDR